MGDAKYKLSRDLKRLLFWLYFITCVVMFIVEIITNNVCYEGFLLKKFYPGLDQTNIISNVISVGVISALLPSILSIIAIQFSMPNEKWYSLSRAELRQLAGSDKFSFDSPLYFMATSFLVTFLCVLLHLPLTLIHLSVWSILFSLVLVLIERKFIDPYESMFAVYAMRYFKWISNSSGVYTAKERHDAKPAIKLIVAFLDDDYAMECFTALKEKNKYKIAALWLAIDKIYRDRIQYSRKDEILFTFERGITWLTPLLIKEDIRVTPIARQEYLRLLNEYLSTATTPKDYHDRASRMMRDNQCDLRAEGWSVLLADYIATFPTKELTCFFLVLLIESTNDLNRPFSAYIFAFYALILYKPEKETDQFYKSDPFIEPKNNDNMGFYLLHEAITDYFQKSFEDAQFIEVCESIRKALLQGKYKRQSIDTNIVTSSVYIFAFVMLHLESPDKAIAFLSASEAKKIDGAYSVATDPKFKKKICNLMQVMGFTTHKAKNALEKLEALLGG